MILGADGIYANGDVVNKVGTYSHALGAARAGIPFLVVAPESTVDMETEERRRTVEIEDRGAAEITATGLPGGGGESRVRRHPARSCHRDRHRPPGRAA